MVLVAIAKKQLHWRGALIVEIRVELDSVTLQWSTCFRGVPRAAPRVGYGLQTILLQSVHFRESTLRYVGRSTVAVSNVGHPLKDEDDDLPRYFFGGRTLVSVSRSLHLPRPHIVDGALCHSNGTLQTSHIQDFVGDRRRAKGEGSTASIQKNVRKLWPYVSTPCHSLWVVVLCTVVVVVVVFFALETMHEVDEALVTIMCCTTLDTVRAGPACDRNPKI